LNGPYDTFDLQKYKNKLKIKNSWRTNFFICSSSKGVIVFGRPNPYSLIIEDSTDKDIRLPVEILKTTGRVDINLVDYDAFGKFDKFWRIRLDSIRIVLLNESGNPIASPGSSLGGYIEVIVTYPTLFNDTNGGKEKCPFLAMDFVCPAEYYTDGQGILISKTSAATEN
jgi:hypothetical protein